jgi:hypothetical protein
MIRDVVLMGIGRPRALSINSVGAVLVYCTSSMSCALTAPIRIGVRRPRSLPVNPVGGLFSVVYRLDVVCADGANFRMVTSI